MSNRRNALGRGIGALIPGAPAHASVEAPPPRPAAGRPAEIPVDAIEPNPEQPRRRFETVELDRLAESIRLHGVLQPIVVRRAGDRYELVVGERRSSPTSKARIASSSRWSRTFSVTTSIPWSWPTPSARWRITA
jgi:ParB family chromosome partitioning protein